MTRQVTLSVNDRPIDIDYFTQGFIDHVAGGMLEALEGVGELKNAVLVMKGDSVQVEVNNGSVLLNPFVIKLVGNTLKGMVSTLKGVAEMESLKIDIRR